jgi:hypothetical protein
MRSQLRFRNFANAPKTYLTYFHVCLSEKLDSLCFYSNITYKNVQIDYFIVTNQIRPLSFIFRKIQLGGDMSEKGEVTCKK